MEFFIRVDPYQKTLDVSHGHTGVAAYNVTGPSAMGRTVTLNILLAIHVLGVVWWVGGVAMVTATLLPIFNRLPADERIQRIKQLEGRFANQARVAVLLVGISGFWMYTLLPGEVTHTWWIGLMLLVWVLFAIMLFVAEPRLPAKIGVIQNPRRFLLLHAVLLILAMAAIAGGVIGARGGL